MMAIFHTQLLTIVGMQGEGSGEGKSAREVARTFQIHPATLYRALAPGI